MLSQRRGLDTRAAEDRARALRANLRFEQDLAKRIRELENHYHQTRRELGLTPQALANAVHTGLALAHRPPLIPHTHARPGTFFHMPELDGAWQACCAGLAHPAFPDEIRPISFEPEAIALHDDAVLIHLGHELVQHCLRLLRAEVWSTQDSRRLARTCARLVADQHFPETPHIHLVVHARLLVVGAGHQRLHEELLVAGGSLVEGRFKPAQPAALQTLLAAASADQPGPATLDALTRAWPQQRAPLAKALETAVAKHASRQCQLLEQQCADQLAKIDAIFDELARELHRKLAEQPPAQLDLFADEERQQLHSDREALERRHKSLSSERAREQDQVRRRFAEPQSRHFPVAITWLVPQSQDR